MSADPLIRLLKVLRSRAAIPEDVLFAAVSTPKMREVLASRHEEAVAVIRQTPPKTTSPKASAKVTPLPSAAEIRERAEASLISLVRNNAPTHFLEGRIWRHWTQGEFRRRLKMPPEDKRDPVVFLREACEAIQERTKLATISLSSNSGYSFPTIEIKLHPEATWNEVVREVCKLAQSEPLPLTTAGQALLDMLEDGSTDWTDRNTVAKRMGKARYTRFEPFVCAELASKRGIKVTFEERKKDGAPHDMEVKFSIAARGTAETPVLTNVIHWSWKGSLDFQSKANRDLFRRSIVDHITSTQPGGSEPIYLFKVHTVAGLAAVFVKAELSRYYLSRQLAELFSELGLPDGITVAFDFSENSSEWWAALVPTVSWENGLKSITAEKERPSLEQRFGLKHDAARLLEWIESLKPESMLGTWTPPVEPAIEREIGFLTEWPNDNIPALLQMLVDEINEKTAYSLSLQPWRAAGELQTRIKVVKQADADHSIDEAVAALARKRGIKLSVETMKAITDLLR